MIPKVIHLCWLSGDKYPKKVSKCIRSWKKYLPDYEIILWDKNRFDVSSSLWVKQAYEKKKYAFAADYIRFYALYNYGGIYLDSDVEVLRNFDDLLDLPYFIGAEKSQIPEAAVIGAEKGCDWIGKCLEYYQDRSFIKDDGSLDIQVVPHIIIKQASLIKPVRVLSIDDSVKIKGLDLRKELLVLNDAFFSPKVFDSRKVQLTPYTYAIHHFNNTWFSPKAKIYYRCRSVVVNMIGLKAVRKTESIVMPRIFKRHK